MIQVFIGISERFDCIKGLTEKSILANTNAEVAISHLYPEKEEGCTGFSNVRYAIKKGIYLDPDMIVLGDIADLWAYHRPKKYVCMQDGSSEVAVIDCEHSCKNKFDERKLPKLPIIPLEWNIEDCDYFDKALPKNIKLFHFTDLRYQPWFHKHHHKDAIALYEEYLALVPKNKKTLS